MNRKWLLEVLRDETKSALILFSVAACTLLIVFSPFAASLFTFADSTITFGALQTDFRTFASEYLLAIFFLIAGIELRHELSVGSLNSFKSASVPLLAALGGMILPALIYLRLSNVDNAWGSPMATDLPFALGVIAIFGKHLSIELRAFLLALAIVDDALSVLLITFALGHSSIHPTFIAVLLGLLLPTRNGFAEKIRHLSQPISSGIALPLFALTSLATPLDLASLFNDQTTAISIARLVGKPLGIFIGALIAVAIFKSKPSISYKEILTVGCVASIGFSVSLLFVNLSDLTSNQAISTTGAVIVAIPLSATIGALASLVTNYPSRKPK